MYLLIIIFMILLYLWYVKIYLFNKKLDRFVLPPTNLFFGHALQFVSSKGKIDILYDLIKMNGETVQLKIGLNRSNLLTTDPNLIEFILTSNLTLNKSRAYRYLNRWLGRGLLTSDGDNNWKRHRYILTPAFHKKILENSIKIFEKNANILVDLLDNEVGKNHFNICPYITLCSLDIICEAAMGTSINAQLYQDSNYVRSVKEMCRIVITRSFSFHKMYDLLYFFTEDYRKEKSALNILHSYTCNVINDKLQLLEDNKDDKKSLIRNDRQAFLDLLLDEYKLNTLTFDEIRQEVDTFMFAGHDTTAAILNFAIHCLSNYEIIQEKAYQEQLTIFQDNLMREMNNDDLKRMQYLENIVKETLRMYPSVPYYSRQLHQEIIYNGQVLPKGLTIAIFPFALHRNPEYFPNPEIFDPSRFEKSNNLPFVYLPFSAGQRNCIGQKFALMEIKGILSILLRNYQFLPTFPKHELKLDSEIVLISTNGVNIQLKKRINNNNNKK